MKNEEVQKLYDAGYANAYNERYLLNPFSKSTTNVELSVLRNLLTNESRWLDIGCGTGYFLSQFPGIQRAGFDLSSEMLKLAANANPDALFFKQGDFREKNEEWNSSWSLVSCMWCAYNYVDSMKELEQLIMNMIAWVKPGGAIFIPVMDLEDIRPNRQLPYAEEAGMFGGIIYLTSSTWTWVEQNGNVHKHLVAPHIEFFIYLLQKSFNKIEIIRYPPYMPGWVSRKAIVGTGKKINTDDETKAEIKWQPIPAPENNSQVKSFTSPASFLSHKQLLGELYLRIRSGILFRSVAKKVFRK